VPLFSIAIPTRNRADLTRRAVDCVFAQKFTDWELLVLDNSDVTLLTDRDFGDDRCRVMPSAATLSMPDNWERAIELSSGQYLIVLSDKDMLVPDALGRIARVIEEYRPDIITFRKAGFVVNGMGFIQSCSGRTSRHSTDQALKAWFHQVRHQHNAPMVYNSAIRRCLIVRQRRNNRFFVGCAPDVAPGVILAASTDSFVLLDRPLVLSLYGDWSIGLAASNGSHGAAQKWLSEFRQNPLAREGIVEGVVGAVAETLLACKRQYSSELKSWSICWPAYVRNVLWELHGRRAAGTSIAASLRLLRRMRLEPYTPIDLSRGYIRYWGERAIASDCMSRLGRLVRAVTGSARKAGSLASPAIDPTRKLPATLESSDKASQFVDYGETDAIYPSYVSLEPTVTFEQAFALMSRINDLLDVDLSRDIAHASTIYAPDESLPAEAFHTVRQV
jgi:hypothetical protein